MGNWKTPNDCKYTKSDEWVKVDGAEALIGITDYAQSQLSDLVFVELPKVGATFSTGQPCGVVESVKAAADFNIPVSGEIVAVNGELEDAPEVVNQDAYGKGWIARIKPTNPAEIDALMDAAAYSKYCDERA